MQIDTYDTNNVLIPWYRNVLLVSIGSLGYGNINAVIPVVLFYLLVLYHCIVVSLL